MRQEKRGNATASPLWPEIGAEVEADVASQAQKDSDLDLGFAESTLFKLLYFSFYSSAGVLFPYYALFFQSKGFSKSAIGMLCMIPNMTSFIFAPLINYFADKWKRNFEVMHISLLLSGVLNFVLLYFSDSLTTVTILVFLSSIVKCPVSPLIDSMVVSSLKDASDYGHMRQFGAMSFGIFSLGGGIMLTVGHEWSFPLLFIGSRASRAWSYFFHGNEAVAPLPLVAGTQAPPRPLVVPTGRALPGARRRHTATAQHLHGIVGASRPPPKAQDRCGEHPVTEALAYIG